MLLYYHTGERTNLPEQPHPTDETQLIYTCMACQTPLCPLDLEPKASEGERVEPGCHKMRQIGSPRKLRI